MSGAAAEPLGGSFVVKSQGFTRLRGAVLSLLMGVVVAGQLIRGEPARSPFVFLLSLAVLYVCLRSFWVRVEVSNGEVTVVNHLRRHSFPVAEVQGFASETQGLYVPASCQMLVVVLESTNGLANPRTETGLLLRRSKIDGVITALNAALIDQPGPGEQAEARRSNRIGEGSTGDI